MKTKILFLFKIILLFNLVVSQPYHFDGIDTSYTAVNTKMNHLLYNYGDNLPYSAFYLNDDANSSTTSFEDKISGIRYEPRSQEVKINFLSILFYF